MPVTRQSSASHHAASTQLSQTASPSTDPIHSAGRNPELSLAQFREDSGVPLPPYAASSQTAYPMVSDMSHSWAGTDPFAADGLMTNAHHCLSNDMAAHVLESPSLTVSQHRNASEENGPPLVYRNASSDSRIPDPATSHSSHIPLGTVSPAFNAEFLRSQHRTPADASHPNDLSTLSVAHHARPSDGSATRPSDAGSGTLRTTYPMHQATPAQQTFDIDRSGSISPQSNGVSASPGTPNEMTQAAAHGLGLGLHSVARRYTPQHHRQSSLGQMGALAQSQGQMGVLAQSQGQLNLTPSRSPAHPLAVYGDTVFDNAPSVNITSSGPGVPGRIVTTRTGTTPGLANMSIFPISTGNGTAGANASTAAFVRSLSQQQSYTTRSSSPSGSIASSWNSPTGFMAGSLNSSNFSPLTSTSASDSRFPAAVSMDSRDTSMDSLDNSTSASRASSTSEDLLFFDHRELGRFHTKKKVKLLNIDRKRICERHEAQPKLKQEELAAIFGVERSTVSKVLKEKSRWLAVQEDSLDAKIVKHRQAKFPEVEKRTLLWAQQAQAAGEILTDAVIKEQALAFAQAIGGPAEKFKASGGWVDKFRVRSGLRKDGLRYRPSAGANLSDERLSSVQEAPVESTSTVAPKSPSHSRTTRASVAAAAAAATTSLSHPSLSLPVPSDGRLTSQLSALPMSRTSTPQTPVRQDDLLPPHSAPSVFRADVPASEQIAASSIVRTTPNSKQKRHYDAIASLPLSFEGPQSTSSSLSQDWDHVSGPDSGHTRPDSKRRRGSPTDTSMHVTLRPEGNSGVFGTPSRDHRAVASVQNHLHSAALPHRPGQPGTLLSATLGSPFSEVSRINQQQQQQQQQQQLEEDFHQRRVASAQAIAGRDSLASEAQQPNVSSVARPDASEHARQLDSIERDGFARSAVMHQAVLDSAAPEDRVTGRKPASPLRPLRLSDLGRSNTSPCFVSAGTLATGRSEQSSSGTGLDGAALVHAAVPMALPAGEGVSGADTVPVAVKGWTSSGPPSPRTRDPSLAGQQRAVEEPVSLEQARQSLDVVLQFLNESEADIIPRAHFLTLGSLHGSLAAAAERGRADDADHGQDS
ncbi:unnamed protein product [Parajaminaea phylloscopi]